MTTGSQVKESDPRISVISMFLNYIIRRSCTEVVIVVLSNQERKRKSAWDVVLLVL